MVFRGLPNTKENLCRVALEDCQSSAELTGKRVEKREKEIRSTRNEIYQVVGFYSAFQGLLLTAVAQSNLLHWNNGGYPLALSAFAAGTVAIGAVQKNKIISTWNGQTSKKTQHERYHVSVYFGSYSKYSIGLNFFHIHITSWFRVFPLFAACSLRRFS
jgi:hypothetical protein